MFFTLLIWISMASAAPLLDLDFTESSSGMTNNNGLQWQWGEVTAGPAGFSGHAWATRIDGNYLNDATDTLGLPPLDLSGVERPVLVLEHGFDIDESGGGDLGWLEVLQDGESIRLTPVHGYPGEQGFTGASMGIRTDYFDLSGIDTTEDLQLVFDADEAVARAGWMITALRIDDGDPAPPIIEFVTELSDTQNLGGPYLVHAEVRDDLVAPQVTLHWRKDGGNQGSAEMLPVGADLYRGEIPGMPVGSRVKWWIRATDDENTTTWPDEGKAEFNVFLAAPTALSAPDARPDGRVSGLTVDLEWTAPVSPQPLLHTVILRDGERVGTAAGTKAEVPMTAAAHTFTVVGVFDTPQGRVRGDEAEAIKLSIALPLANPLMPNHGYQGDTLRLAISGVNLLMAHGQIAMLLGEGLHKTALEIIDADTAIVTVQIDADAPIQTSDVSLLSGSAIVPFPEGFEVRDGADRPRLTAVSPRSIKQGQQTFITLTSNAPINADPIVDLGEDVFVLSTQVDGDTLTLEIAAAIDSPIGDHQITVDDGLRILDGLSLEIRDARPPPGKLCATSAGQTGGAWAWTLACLMAWRRRKKRTKALAR